MQGGLLQGPAASGTGGGADEKIFQSNILWNPNSRKINEMFVQYEQLLFTNIRFKIRHTKQTRELERNVE